MRLKSVLLVAMYVLLAMPIMAQKKKKAMMNKIESTTVLNEDYEKNNGRSVKESYTRFNESGDVVEEIEYDEYGKEKKHILYEYDTDGNKIKETYLNSKGLKEKTIEFKYMDGLKTEKLVYDSKGKLKLKKRYIYTFY